MHPREIALKLQRPDEWAERTEIFGLHVVGSSMEERYYSGEVIFVEPTPAPRASDFIVIEMQPNDDGTVDMYLKQFVKQDVDSVTVRQFKPAQTDNIPQAKIRRLLRVLSLEATLRR